MQSSGRDEQGHGLSGSPAQAFNRHPSAWQQLKAVLHKNWLLRLKGG